MKAFLVLAVCFVVVAADNIDFYTDCGSKTGSIKSISVAGCSSNPCQLPRGKTTSFEVDFVSNVNSNTLKAKVIGHLEAGPVPWTGVPKNACSGTTCPLVSGSSYGYKVDVKVLAWFPPVPVTVEYMLKDDHDSNVVCFKLPVVLV